MATEATLFGDKVVSGYFLSFTYDGPSFDGHIDLEKLAKELEGLNTALQIGLSTLVRHKRININLRDVEIYVEPFEKGSFKKKLGIKLRRHTDKNYNQYSLGLQLASVIIGSILLVKDKPAQEIVEMPPQLQQEIRDPATVEMLKNKDFIRGIAATAEPLYEDEDKLLMCTPDDKSVSIDRDSKLKLELLVGKEKEPVVRTVEETLTGRISLVNLDATSNHLGFKVNGAGAKVDSTLLEPPSKEVMKTFLGGWVKITGTTTFRDDVRVHIDILNIELAEPPSQQQLVLESA